MRNCLTKVVRFQKQQNLAALVNKRQLFTGTTLGTVFDYFPKIFSLSVKSNYYEAIKVKN